MTKINEWKTCEGREEESICSHVARWKLRILELGSGNGWLALNVANLAEEGGTVDLVR